MHEVLFRSPAAKIMKDIEEKIIKSMINENNIFIQDMFTGP